MHVLNFLMRTADIIKKIKGQTLYTLSGQSRLVLVDRKMRCTSAVL